jgi:hypothetical protein
MSMVIFDQSFTFFDFVDGSHGLISYTHHVVGVETQPFIISLFPTNGGFYGDYRLNVQLGAPNAQLSATPHSGPSPLNVTLDASASTDAPPGTIVSYEFDPEGTGTFLSPQAGATLAHLYQNDGIYYPRVRVTDDEGNISIARTSVLPGYDYDETEDNDFESEANQLTLPVAGFKGSLGTDAGYPGYDGDFDDYYQFSANIGDTVRATVTYDPANGNPDLEFHDDSFNINDGATGQDGKLVFSYNVNGTETQPFTLALHGFAFFGDYAMDVAVNPPTAELSATPNSGNPVLDVVLDASASSDFPPGTIATYEFDPEGDGTFLPPQAGPAMNFSYTTAGVFAPQVRVTDDEGYTDVAETLVLVGVTFNEIEPNDDQAQANQLPASLNFNNYAGSHSHGPGYHGYDGSKIDMFRFIAAPGSDVTLTAAYSNTTGELTLSMFDQFGNWVAEGGGVGGVATVDYILGSQPGDAGAPYFLQIWDPNDQHYGDYLLSGSRT